MLKTDGHGTIRKVKGGAVGVIALSGLMLSMNAVSADTQVDASTDVSVQTAAKEGSSKEVPKNTKSEYYEKADSTELTATVNGAKNKGVTVNEDTKPLIKDSKSEANKAVADQVNQVNEATKLQEKGDKDLASNKDKLKGSDLSVIDGGVEVFTDLAKMQAFLDEQNKSVNDAVTSKQNSDTAFKLATKELTDAGIEVTVGSKVMKHSASEVLEAIKELQKRAATSVKTKAELDKLFNDLKTLANSVGLVVKDDEVVSFDDASKAKDFLTRQIDELNTLIKSLNQENAKLDAAVKVAQSKGIVVTKNEASTVSSNNELTKLVAQQVAKLQSLVKAVDESKALIDASVSKAKQAGVLLEGETVVGLTKNEDPSKLKEKAQAATQELEAAAKAQASTKATFDKLVADARAKGLEVTVSGNKKVTVSGANAELEAIKTKITKALADKNKAQSDYTSAVANANGANRLVDKSGAKKEGDLYKGSLVIKSEGTSGAANITTAGSAELVSFELIDPTGAKVTTVKTLEDLNRYNTFNKKGDYVLNYVFRAKDKTAGQIDVKGITEGTRGNEAKLVANLSVTTKAPMSTNVENQIEPLITDHVYDFSSSYYGKIEDSLRLSKDIINANTNPDSRHIIQLYHDNYTQSSYHANIRKDIHEAVGLSTKLLTKQEALQVIDNILKVLADKSTKYANEATFYQGLGAAMGDYRYTKDLPNYIDQNVNENPGFEEVVDALVKPTDTISVIQYTDGWLAQGIPEVMDKSFANWAKGRVKTFMTVVNRNKVTENDTNTMQSINQMTALGHPNIYDMTGKDPKVVHDEVLKQFMETATVKAKVVRGENQLVTVSIGGDGIRVTKATLKGPNTTKDLPIVNNKVNFSEKLPDGDWTVTYELAGDGTANILATVAGKEVVKETKGLKGSKGASGYNAFITHKLLPAENPVLAKTPGLTLESPVVTAKNVKLGQVETDVTPSSIRKDLNKANFKETVNPLSFEHTVKQAKASVTTQDVYLKVVFDKGIPEVRDKGEYHEQKGTPEVNVKPRKEVVLYLDIEDNSILEDGTVKVLSKEAPQYLRNGQYVFTGKTEEFDGIIKHYYRKVKVEKPTFKPKVEKPAPKALPETAGQNNPVLSAIGGSMILGALGAVGLKKKKEN